MDGSPHDGADFCFLWLAFLKQYINIPQSRRFPFLWPVSPEKDAPGKGKRPCHAGECRFRRHTKTETGCTTSTPHAEKCRFRRLPAFYERGSALRGREGPSPPPRFSTIPGKRNGSHSPSFKHPPAFVKILLGTFIAGSPAASAGDIGGRVCPRPEGVFRPG